MATANEVRTRSERGHNEVTYHMSYKTGIEIDSDVHEYLFKAKKRPSEPFNTALRRELGMPSPDSSDDEGDEDSEGDETEAIEAD